VRDRSANVNEVSSERDICQQTRMRILMRDAYKQTKIKFPLVRERCISGQE
jgi:hypothetical protein